MNLGHLKFYRLHDLSAFYVREIRSYS